MYVLKSLVMLEALKRLDQVFDKIEYLHAQADFFVSIFILDYSYTVLSRGIQHMLCDIDSLVLIR